MPSKEGFKIPKGWHKINTRKERPKKFGDRWRLKRQGGHTKIEQWCGSLAPGTPFGHGVIYIRKDAQGETNDRRIR